MVSQRTSRNTIAYMRSLWQARPAHLHLHLRLAHCRWHHPLGKFLFSFWGSDSEHFQALVLKAWFWSLNFPGIERILYKHLPNTVKPDTLNFKIKILRDTNCQCLLYAESRHEWFIVSLLFLLFHPICCWSVPCHHLPAKWNSCEAFFIPHSSTFSLEPKLNIHRNGWKHVSLEKSVSILPRPILANP